MVTADWVDNYLIQNWSDDDINRLLNNIFSVISNDVEWDGDNTVQTITDFVQRKLRLENNSEDLVNHMNGTALANKLSGDFGPGQEFCSPGYSVAHVEFESDDSENQGTLPGKLKYYCRSNADSGEATKQYLRITGPELIKFRYAETSQIFDCERR